MVDTIGERVVLTAGIGAVTSVDNTGVVAEADSKAG